MPRGLVAAGVPLDTTAAPFSDPVCAPGAKVATAFQIAPAVIDPKPKLTPLTESNALIEVDPFI